ncbi:hypothetical protein [Tsukamurella sp. 1534]|uniref:hypothetical protein n=1 Tax=Tsukamurella sp. 1534 TaxID=1151061 RepID=UPI0002E50106|nr:hypothetical protein [Tsukamurella sp. 1534]
MHAKKLGAAAAALLTAAALVSCGSDDKADSPISWSSVTGDQYTANPGAWQTDGVPSPARDVTMLGDPVAAQAVANAGLQQGTITATGGDATVYYPKAPDVPGLPVAPPDVAPPPPPFERPANTRPWNYTDLQLAAYQEICETGAWNDWVAGPDVQAQTCWTLYGRQLGVRPWHPGEPRPWEERDTWPTPWFEPEFRADVPVMWVYPKSWTKPRPQPVISASIGINLPGNPHAKPNPRFRDDLFFPVWAVTPGRPVAVRDQARVVAPYLPIYSSTTVTRETYSAPPVYPGLTLATIPTSGRADVVTAAPGQQVLGNPYTDAKVVMPTAAAIRGATLYSGSRADLMTLYGDDVDVRVASDRESSTTTRRTSKAKKSTSSATTTTTSAKKTTTDETTTRARATTSDETSTTTTTRRKSAESTSEETTKTTSRAPSSSKAETTTSKRATTTTTAPRTSAETTTTTKARTTTTTPKRAATTTTTTTPAR